MGTVLIDNKLILASISRSSKLLLQSMIKIDCRSMWRRKVRYFTGNTKRLGIFDIAGKAVD